MNKIASFTVNHLDLLPGIYVSRKDYIGEEVVTTFDLRFTRPNEESPMDNPGIHTIEHLGATFLRNHPTWGEKTIYFGPMGCRTGFYVIFSGDLKSEDIIELLKEMAVKYNRSIAQICIRWIVQRGVLPLPKSTRLERIQENANVFDFNISFDDMQKIATLRSFGMIGESSDIPRVKQNVGF